MKFTHILSFILCMVSFCTCTKYKVQYEGPYSDDDTPQGVNYTILTILDGSVTLFSPDFNFSKEVEGVPSGVTEASISFDHSKIAYKLPSQNIQVIDTAGKFIAEVIGSETAYGFEWHSNNQTLYYLDENQIYFFGPSLPVSITNLEVLFPVGSSVKEIKGIAITSNNSLWVLYAYYSSQNGGIGSYIEGRSETGTELLKYKIGNNVKSTWMRATLAGDEVYFDVQSPQIEGVFSVFNSNAAGVFDYHKYFAFNSDATLSVFSDGKSLARYISTGAIEQKNFNGAKLTALDW